MKQIERLREKQAKEMIAAIQERDAAQSVFTEAARRVNELEAKHQGERSKLVQEIQGKQNATAKALRGGK